MCDCFIPTGKISLVFYERNIHDLPYSKFGVCFPREVILVWAGQSFSCQGISDLLENNTVESAIWARFVALVWMVFYILLFPIMVLTYVILFIFSVIVWFFLWPFLLCSEHDSSFRLFMQGIGALFIIYFPTSLLVMLSFLLLSPIQVIVPELTAKVLKIHKWTR